MSGIDEGIKRRLTHKTTEQDLRETKNARWRDNHTQQRNLRQIKEELLEEIIDIDEELARLECAMREEELADRESDNIRYLEQNGANVISERIRQLPAGYEEEIVLVRVTVEPADARAAHTTAATVTHPVSSVALFLLDSFFEDGREWYPVVEKSLASGEYTEMETDGKEGCEPLFVYKKLGYEPPKKKKN
jgi:hypothetical protein